MATHILVCTFEQISEQKSNRAVVLFMKQQEGKMQRQTLAFSGFKAPPPELTLFYSLGAEILAAAQLLHLLKHPAPTRTPPSTRSTPTGNMQDAPSDICFTHKDTPPAPVEMLDSAPWIGLCGGAPQEF